MSYRMHWLAGIFTANLDIVAMAVAKAYISRRADILWVILVNTSPIEIASQSTDKGRSE